MWCARRLRVCAQQRLDLLRRGALANAGGASQSDAGIILASISNCAIYFQINIFRRPWLARYASRPRSRPSPRFAAATSRI
jgi:hypothetical protein